MKNILFVNAYSARNLGDFAIILGMREVLLRVFDNEVNILVASSYFEDNKQFYPIDLISGDSVWNISRGSFLSRYAKGLYLFFLAIVFPSSKEFACFRNADLICSVGGGYLYSSIKGPFGVGLLNMLFNIWLGIRFKKKVVCFPQSVGPIYSRLDAWLLKKVLSRVNVFVSREAITTKYLMDKLGLLNVYESIDVAFSLTPSDSYLQKSDFHRYDLVIGVTVLDWRFAIKGSNDEDILRYLKKISNVILSLAKTKKIKVIVFPQVTVGEGDTDQEVSEKLVALIGENVSEVFDFPEKFDPRRLMATYGDVDLFIGSRMHSTIFALATGCKTIGLAYQPKTTATFKLLGLEKNVLPINDFSEQELLKLILEIKQNTEITHSIKAYKENVIKIISDVSH